MGLKRVQHIRHLPFVHLTWVWYPALHMVSQRQGVIPELRHRSKPWVQKPQGLQSWARSCKAAGATRAGRPAAGWGAHLGMPKCSCPGRDVGGGGRQTLLSSFPTVKLFPYITALTWGRSQRCVQRALSRFNYHYINTWAQTGVTQKFIVLSTV